jgi:hypothetical protein
MECQVTSTLCSGERQHAVAITLEKSRARNLIIKYFLHRFRASDGLTYFFKDSQYYLFNDTLHQVDTGYPKPISSFWKGIPKDIGTVFRWSNGQTYFFKDKQYYRFNFTRGAVDDGYPREIAGAWRGIMYNANS